MYENAEERRDGSTVIDERLAYLEGQERRGELTDSEAKSLAVLRRAKANLS